MQVCTRLLLLFFKYKGGGGRGRGEGGQTPHTVDGDVLAGDEGARRPAKGAPSSNTPRLILLSAPRFSKGAVRSQQRCVSGRPAEEIKHPAPQEKEEEKIQRP